MISTTHNQSWGHKTMPPSFDECRSKPTRRSHRYTVEAASYAMFIGALEAKRSRRLSRCLTISMPTIPLPAQNVAAIKLLDSWLSVPETDNSVRADEMRRRIDENRLSDRKFFT